jgi:hypothetical protein
MLSCCTSVTVLFFPNLRAATSAFFVHYYGQMLPATLYGRNPVVWHSSQRDVSHVCHTSSYTCCLTHWGFHMPWEEDDHCILWIWEFATDFHIQIRIIFEFPHSVWEQLDLILPVCVACYFVLVDALLGLPDTCVALQMVQC